MVPHTLYLGAATQNEPALAAYSAKADGSFDTALIAALASRSLRRPVHRNGDRRPYSPCSRARRRGTARQLDVLQTASRGPLPGFSLLPFRRGVVPPTLTVWAPHTKNGSK